MPAYDNAADSAYAAGWTDGSNGGSGFGPWRITTNSDAQHFAGTFIGDANASGVNGAIGIGGKAFGMYSNVSGNVSGASVSAIRDFTGGVLLPGQSFSLQIAVNYRDGAKGVNFNSTDPNLSTVGSFFIGGSPQHYSFTLYDRPTNSPITIDFSDYHPDALFTVTLTQLGLTQLQEHVTLLTSSGLTDLGTITANVFAPTVSGFNLFYGSTAPAFPQDDLFFNNFTVSGAVPEPGTWVLLLAGASHIGARQVWRQRAREIPGFWS